MKEIFRSKNVSQQVFSICFDSIVVVFIIVYSLLCFTITKQKLKMMLFTIATKHPETVKRKRLKKMWRGSYLLSKREWWRVWCQLGRDRVKRCHDCHQEAWRNHKQVWWLSKNKYWKKLKMLNSWLRQQVSVYLGYISK